MTSKALRNSQAATYSTPRGPSLLELIEGELDETFVALKALKDSPQYNPEESRLKGFAQGLVRSIAILRSPYDVESGEVLARASAVERFQARASDTVNEGDIDHG